MLFYKIFVNSFLLLQFTVLYSSGYVCFPDMAGVQNLETVDLLFVNYLSQIRMQEHDKSFGRHNLTCTPTVLRGEMR